jgi:hypothetical protein
MQAHGVRPDARRRTGVIRRIIRSEMDYEVRRGRFVANEPGAVVRETEALYHRPAAELWVAPLSGRAR